MKLVSVLVIFVFLAGCVSNLFLPAGVMTKSKVKRSLQQLRDFEQSDVLAEVVLAKQQFSEFLAKHPWPAEELGDPCIDPWTGIKTRFGLKLGGGCYFEEEGHHEKRLKTVFLADLGRDFTHEMNFVLDDALKVEIQFKHAARLRKKYMVVSSDKKYSSNVKYLLSHYLGADYERYSPHIKFISSEIEIVVYVNNSKELEALLEDKRVVNIRHIATPPDERMYKHEEITR